MVEQADEHHGVFRRGDDYGDAAAELDAAVVGAGQFAAVLAEVSGDADQGPLSVVGVVVGQRAVFAGYVECVAVHI